MAYFRQHLFDLTYIIPDLLGIIGVFLILYYYFLLQAGKCTAQNLSFSLGNMVGAILVLISLWFQWNLASVLIEIAWCFISGYGLIKHYTKSKKSFNENFKN